MTSTSDNLAVAAAVGDFVEMWSADQRRGLVRPLADYLARFPGFESSIAREYLSLVEPQPSPPKLGAADPEHSFGPYRTLRLLGQGGQGAVWLAEDTRIGRHVALKVLSANAATMSLARVERLRREAQTLARLDHPGICAIYEAELDVQHPYLAMRYVEGETLAAILARQGISPAPAVPDRTHVAGWLPFFAEVADALHAAHELGIVHRDVKPGNLMRTREGAPVVLDFGLARDLESTAVSLTQSGELFGTLAYMAPEVLLGRTADRRVDVYALGIALFEMVAGRRPFVGATHAALRRAIEMGETTALSDLIIAGGADLAVVITTAIERDPDRRYRTAKAFADDLRRAQQGEPIAARPIGPGVRVRRAFTRHPVI
ncbi:MAG: serine/threonine-protein kinase, partial [Planctomycetota bacterium]